jgi:hypothetical protein
MKMTNDVFALNIKHPGPLVTVIVILLGRNVVRYVRST